MQPLRMVTTGVTAASTRSSSINTPALCILLCLQIWPAVAAAHSVDAACRKISDKLSSVGFDECMTLELRPSGYQSSNGFPLLIKEYPPLESRRPKGRVLVVGGTHGDELSSISIVFKWMHTLEKHHSGLFHWRINPLLNPDGALQRKHSRTNANNVDLNRNFVTPGTHVGAALDYWNGRAKRNTRRYPGPYPLSEPETYWLFREIRDFKPDVIVSVSVEKAVDPPDIVESA